MALVALATEEITVGGAAIGITATLLVDADGKTLGAVMAKFQHASGGDIHSNPVNTPVAADGDDFKRSVGNIWEVWGYDDLTNFKMIAQTGESDAKVVMHLFGDK